MAAVHITVAKERLLAFVEQFKDLCSKEESLSTEDFLEYQKLIFSENLNVDIQIEEQFKKAKSKISLESTLKDIWSKNNDISTNSEDEEIEIEEDAIEPDVDTSLVASKIPETETRIINSFEKRKVVPEKKKVNDNKADKIEKVVNVQLTKQEKIWREKHSARREVKTEGVENVPSNKSSKSSKAVNIKEEETLDEKPDIEESKVVEKAKDEKFWNKIMDIPDGKKKSEITKCSECNFQAAGFFILRVHIEMHHLNLRYHCTFCQRDSKEKYIMKIHLKKHHQEKEGDLSKLDYECKRCDLREPMEAFKDHIGLFHPDLNIFYETTKGLGLKQELDCSFCPFKAKIASQLNLHVETSHMNLDYKCKLCNFTCNSFFKIRGHVGSTHIPKSSEYEDRRKAPKELRRFVRLNISRHCQPCEMEVKHKENLTKHIQSSHPEIKYRPECTRRNKSKRGRLSKDSRKMTEPGPNDLNCAECEYSTALKNNLISHTMLQHMHSKFECMECNSKEKQMFRMLRHVKDNHENKSALIKSTCSKCSFTTESLEVFKTHTTEVHLSHLPATSRKTRLRKVKKEKETKILKKRGPKKGHRKTKRSLRVSHDQKPTFNCLACFTETTDKSQIIEHIFENHDVNEDLDEDEQLDDIVKYLKVLCKKCNFSGTFAEYNVHLTSKPEVNQVKPVVNLRCNICKSDSTDERDLSIHNLLVHGKCQYACKSCEFKSPQQGSLLAHSKANHSSCGFQFSCGFCNVKLGKLGMEGHLLEHHQEEFNEKPTKALQKCNECDFQNISDLKLRFHERKVHSVYKCPECEAVFNVKRRYQIHKMHKHKNYTFDCDKCDFKTRHESALWRHGNSIHKTYKFYPCPNCNRPFTRKDNMQDHRKKCMGA